MSPTRPREWFRKQTWSEADRADFEKRLARARPRKRAQYIRIQALHLAGTGDAGVLRAALGLLERVTTDYADDKVQFAQAHAQKADCHWRLGEFELAVKAYRDTFAAERAFPNALTNAWLEFGWRVVRSDRRDLFAEVDALFEERSRDDRWSIPFPVQKYWFHAVRALLADVRGQRPEAAAHARAALDAARMTEAPFRYHREVGLVRVVDADLVRKLSGLAPS
jgi:hypothetical protein